MAIRVVHYINQFFADVGGEELAGYRPEVREGAVGFGLMLKRALGAEAEIVATVICGDGYYADHTEEARIMCYQLVNAQNPDLFIAGPAFDAGRYGYACGDISATVAVGLKIPTVTAMYNGNPSFELYSEMTNIIPCADSALGMGEAVYAMAELGLSLVNKNQACSKSTGIGATAAGITYADVSNASAIYFDDKIMSPKGHGFAAEHANHLADLYQGKSAKLEGHNNATNGADRIVDGIKIQSKYCSSGARCVQECFDNEGFRYWNADKTPMQIEVPSDMYDSAIQAMENRIRCGDVEGVTDPAEARNIIRKGHFTYAQVKNIAKAGTVESICYDAASGAIIAANTFGITSVLTFATAIWNGEDLCEALKHAAGQGLKVGGITFVSAVLAGQLSKAGLNGVLTGGSETVIKIIGHQGLSSSC